MQTLETILLALSSQDHLVVLDIGRDWTIVTWSDHPSFIPASPEWIAQARASLCPRPAADVPFSGGLVGWLGYEAGRFVERMPAPSSPPKTADLRLWRCEGSLSLHHPTQTWHARGSAAFVRAAEAALQHAATTAPPPSPQPWCPALTGTDTQYQAGVSAILEAIHAGDVYQVNLSWEHEGIPVDDPLRLWLGLRAANPSERGAFIRCGDTTLMSNSPELYLSVSSAGVMRSVPIKGTTRCADGDAGRLHLWSSEKERAELTMITDLVRNDMGRVARIGSVRASPRQLRRCGDLIHAEQEISAELRGDTDAFDAVAATFPPGSVTGAPKVSAMSLIHRLEGRPRGVYTGAIGFFGDDGAAHFNVAIRTAVVQGGEGRFHVGAGIVADSDPLREWQETLAKGQALASWLGAR
jgi:anthranilate/para-aminobenzoate synthase component I